MLQGDITSNTDDTIGDQSYKLVAAKLQLKMDIIRGIWQTGLGRKQYGGCWPPSNRAASNHQSNRDKSFLTE